MYKILIDDIWNTIKSMFFSFKAQNLKNEIRRKSSGYSLQCFESLQSRCFWSRILGDTDDLNRTPEAETVTRIRYKTNLMWNALIEILETRYI